MYGKPVGQLLPYLLAICSIGMLNQQPVNAQSQMDDEKRHGSIFFQCRQKIEEKEDAGCISLTESLKLQSQLAALQRHDNQYRYARYKATGNREAMYQHDPSLVSRTQSIISQLNVQTTVNEQWKKEARDRSWGIMQPGQRPWPPRDSSGNVILGPKKFGTAEQIGWPMYGYSEEEKERYLSGGNLP